MYDPVAHNLEEAGLWRRAAFYWLHLMQRNEYTDVQREWIRVRRQYCLSQIKVIKAEPVDIRAVGKAADAVLSRMGIRCENGDCFRRYQLSKYK